MMPSDGEAEAESLDGRTDVLNTLETVFRSCGETVCEASERVMLRSSAREQSSSSY